VQDTTPTKFEIAVATGVAVPLGAVAFLLVGMEVFAVSVFTVPVLGPLVLAVAAIGGGWLAVRGRRAAKGFGAGAVLGWVSLALWTAGGSAGFGVPGVFG
jgi:hypothetical protein